ncbi:autotransporter outer membrane beta-barrel domain-containing protein [Xenorhabdus sp. KJ12.1]|uniref:autotransporter outer membrane beta-barrel domain-containing protein n=1 Tax=Xenorhabdus sp. KJ12.1 TaxID=1851571 RepID=UPI000C064A47|nr:autotransporter outer membrane beta-barrel domain-containing protein [Xenorhabdus sp. KJ12.1]PHM72990.1 autotransporter protein YapC [Xenorhabdus sp. KJ12.1]
MKRTYLSLAISAFVFGISGMSVADPISGIFGDKFFDYSRDDGGIPHFKNIPSDTVFDNKSMLYLHDSEEIKNVTLNQDSTLKIDGGGTAINTIVNQDSVIFLIKSKLNTPGAPTVQDTIINPGGYLNMEAHAVSKGGLYVAKDAVLTIDNVDGNFVNVKFNTPVPAANVSIENLKLAGLVDITPTWNEDDGEDGDAPFPDKPGPYLVTQIHNLEMLPGSKITMYGYESGAQYNKLEINSLSGTGNFELSTSLADNIGDLIYVTGHASGNFGILVQDRGREIVHTENIRLVYINAGDAQFDLLNKDGIVDIGIHKYRYRLESKKDGEHTEWYLVNEKKELPQKPKKDPTEMTNPTKTDNKSTLVPIGFSSSARNIMSMSASSQHILNTELNTLHQRQGNLRSSDGEMEVWVRHLSDNSRLNTHHYAAFKNTMNGLQIGVGKQFELERGKLLTGAFTSYSKSNVKFNIGGNGDVESYSSGLYATYLDQSGLYFDTVLKGNRLKNQIRTRMNSGDIGRADYNQSAFTASLETGYTLPISQRVTFDPYVRVSYSHISSADYTLSNGMQTDIHGTNSLQSEAGARFGTHLTLGSMEIMPYAKLAVSHEFSGSNKVNINKVTFDNNYSGNTGKYGLGINTNVNKNISVYAEANYLHGNKIETPIHTTAGFKVLF